MLALAAAVAAVAFLIGRASVGWFDDPPRQPMVVPTAPAGQDAPLLAGSPMTAATPFPATATPTPRPIDPPSPSAARPSPSPDTDPAFGRAARQTPTAEPSLRATRRAGRSATPTPNPTARSDEEAGADERPGCDPSYPTVCIPPPPPNGDCSITEERNFPVRPPDPHGLDSDNDGIGCEPVRAP